MRGRARSLRLLASLLGLALALSACGLGTAGGFTRSGSLTGPLDAVSALDGVDITVGSKNFTEQLVLGKIAVVLLKSAGADVTDLTNIPGSSSARQALLQDDIQMMWEYTGTAWIAYLGHTDPIADERAQWQAVHDEDLANGLTWLEPAPMNNTYGFAMSRANAERLGITKLSQIQEIPVADRTFCVEAEFNSRNDGFQPMLDAYDISLGTGVPKQNVKLFDTGAIYVATAHGECTFGEVFTTDGRIKALDLVTLEDDRNFFPAYNVAAVFQTHVLDDNPQLRELFDPVTAALTNEALLDLNAQVDVDGQDPAEVAWKWLVQAGFVH